MKINPLGKFVLVAENKVENKTAGGIILQSTAGADTKTGTILNVGPDVETVTIGDIVFLDWSKGKLITVDGTQRVVIAEEDLIAILEKQ